MIDQIETSNIWDMATMRQRALLRSLDSGTYEKVMEYIIHVNDIDKVRPLLEEALGV
jgi:hypothetical protein